MKWADVKQAVVILLFLGAVIFLYAGCGLQILDINGKYGQ